ncbi:P-selectin isoform X2 [Oncorhynchus masou masou]|uniref:P-selectin isoform X2 n=1 Tax=Oncorhynchus masou masou TaxID=90313 RepID=UPI003183739E
MLPWSNCLRQSLYNRLLVILLMTIYQDLTGETGGVQAWTYNYSVNQNLDWDSARQWCRQDYTDMVAIQNQEEIVYLNTMLPKNSQYYWIGLRKVNEMWTWTGTNKTLTKEAENWATGEPNNIGDGQDCVEIYIKRGKDEAKWNDERCTKKKGALCYTASCSEHCCSAHAECLENIGNYTCQCDPGFKGPRCQEAVECDTVSDPEQGSVNCDHPHGLFAFNSSCQFHCARGYQLQGASQLLCQATGFWDHPAAQCQVKQCPALDSGPHRGTMNCNNPIALHSYNSTCEFSCDLGFDLIGPDRIQCDHTGQWTGNVSTCTVVSCGPLSPPAMGNMSCVDPLGASSFTSSCGFSCEEGYLLRGDTNLTCLSTGQWTNHTPACELVRCGPLSPPAMGNMSCVDPLGASSFTSSCGFSCEEGYLLRGDTNLTCLSTGQWTNHTPACEPQQCDTLTSPLHGSLNCSGLHGQFHYGSQCLFSCEEGFLLNRLADTECTSLGTWSRRAPLCLVVSCGPLSPPAMGNMSCVDPLGASSFTSSCGFSCEEGYLLRGDTNLTCLSTGQWTNHTPACELVRCGPLSPPAMGNMSCVDPLGASSFTSSCGFSCEEGYLLRGDTNLTCLSTGQWTNHTPACELVQCEKLLPRQPSPPPTPSSTPPPTQGPFMNCSHSLGEFSFSSLCLFSCSKGYYLNGTEELSCTSEGQWSDLVPSCQRNINSVQESSRMLVYAVVGVASAAGLLLLLGLGMLATKKLSKKGDFNFDNSLWEERENPAFENS